MTKCPWPPTLSGPNLYLYGTLVQLMLHLDLGWRGGQSGSKPRSNLRRSRLIECHGLPNGVEEDVILKRLSEKRCRAILHGRASDGVLVVCRNDNDPRPGRHGPESLQEFETAHAGDPDID
jgi:hypothetical protein